MFDIVWSGIKLAILLLSGVIAFFCLFFGYILFLHPVVWRAKNRLLEDYGTDVTGSVITYIKQLDSGDSEYYDYNVKFQYMRNGTLRIDTHSICINFMHLDYANRGELDHTPKLVTTLSDLEERFQPDAPVHVTYLAFFPWIKRVEFEPHPNQLIDQKILEAYEKTSR